MPGEELSLPAYEVQEAAGERASADAQATCGLIAAVPAETEKSALLVSPLAEDHEFLGQIFVQHDWILHGTRTLGSALALLRDQPMPVVITERDLPLGDWKDILVAIQQLPHPPLLVVTSRLADEYLWTEVLNLGGHDVLAKPFQAVELRWVLESAWRISAHHQKQTLKSAPVAMGARAR